MSIWKLISGVALIFILGVMVGSVGTRFYFKDRYFPPLEPRDRAAFMMKKLSKELNLTLDQKSRIEKIVDQTAEKLHQHFVQSRPEVQKIINDSFSEISKELNDDQKKKLDILKEKLERRKQAGKG